jgi:hypothetical protein
VLIVVEGAHQAIPATPPVSQPVYIAPAPPGSPGAAAGQAVEVTPGTTGTEADRLRAIYKAAAEAQKHTFGEGGPGIKLPDFTRLPALGAAPNAGGATPVTPPPKALGTPPATPPAGTLPGGPPH